MSEVPIHRIRIGLLVLAVAAILGGAGLVWRGHVADARWQAELAEVRAIEARLSTRVDRRPVLWGETTDERAQPHYDRALLLVEDWEQDMVWAAAQADDEPAREKRRELVALGSEALAALHRGAHAADASWAVDWSLGFEHPGRKLMHTRILSQLSRMKADLLFAEGRELEAVGVLLDVLQLAGDLSQGPSMIEEMVGVAMLAPDFLVEGVSDGTLLALPDDARERLVSGLATLDQRLSWQVPSFEPELVLFARGLDRAFRAGGGLEWSTEGVRSSTGLIRFGRIRTLAAEHVQTMRRLTERYDQAFLEGPTVLFDELECFPELDERDNPISAVFLPKLDSVYRGRFFSLGRFRLLAHALSRDEAPRDPWLAEYLRQEETAAGTRLWLDHEAFGELEIQVAR